MTCNLLVGGAVVGQITGTPEELYRFHTLAAVNERGQVKAKSLRGRATLEGIDDDALVTIEPSQFLNLRKGTL